MTITRNFSVLANGAGSANNLSLGGATLGSNALAVTGSSLFPGSTSISSAGLVGIGMTPSNVLDITQSTNGDAVIKILNNNVGSANRCYLYVNNGTGSGTFQHTGVNYSPSSFYRADATLALGNGAGGLTLGTTAAQPIYFGINNAEKMRLDASGNLGLGVTPSTWNTFTQILQCPSGSLGGTGATDFRVMANLYYNSGWKAYATGQCSQYQQNQGVHSWNCTPSTAAGATPTFTDQLNIYGNTGAYFGDNPTNPSSSPGRFTCGSVSGGGSVLVYGTNTNSGNNYSYFGPTIGSGVYTYETATAFNYSYRVFNGNGLVGSINMSGSTTTFSTTSDETLKNFDVPQRDFKSIIKNVMVQDGEFKADPGDYMLMISAQQCAATGYVDGINCWDDRPDENTGVKATHWSADYARLAPLALWGVKDLYAENEALKATVADLVARLEALEAK